MPIFQSVQDEDLIRSIQRAATRVVFFGPGMSEVVSRMEKASEKKKLTPSAFDLLVCKGLDTFKMNLSVEELKGWFHIFDAAPMVRPGQA